MSDVLIKGGNISKKFCKSLKRSLWYGAQDMEPDVLLLDEVLAVGMLGFGKNNILSKLSKGYIKRRKKVLYFSKD